MPAFLPPMLLATGAPTRRSGWVAQPKMDGWRAQVATRDGKVRCWSRKGHLLKVPELAGLGDIVGHDVHLDGELVVMCGAVADFHALTDRMFRGPSRSKHQLGFLAHDLLGLDGRDLTCEPWQSRQDALRALGLSGPNVGTVPVLAIAQSTAMIALKATLVTAQHDVRERLEPLTDFKLITACAELDSEGPVGDPMAAMRHVLRSLARRWLELHDEIKGHSRQLEQITAAAAPQLIDAYGIGSDIAAEMLITAGDNTDRVRSEAAFAKLCGACPLPAGLGRTNGRHRLNRGGNRQANAALYRAVIVRKRWHAPTIAYVERRTKDGLSKREIIRCLKRYLAREIYYLLPPPAEQELRKVASIDLTISRSLNALAETINGLYKTELIRRRGPWRTLDDVEFATLQWVHWFNTERLHSALGDVPPAEFESAYDARISTANWLKSNSPSLHQTQCASNIVATDTKTWRFRVMSMC